MIMEQKWFNRTSRKTVAEAAYIEMPHERTRKDNEQINVENNLAQSGIRIHQLFFYLIWIKIRYKRSLREDMTN